MINQLKEEKANLNKGEKSADSGSDAQSGTICDRGEQPASQERDKCPSGYKYSPKSGIACIQANCHTEAIPNAHWSYEGYCVCGSLGSIAEKDTDPNKECALPSECAYCPGCVYACVGLKDECPPIPKK